MDTRDNIKLARITSASTWDDSVAILPSSAGLSAKDPAKSAIFLENYNTPLYTRSWHIESAKAILTVCRHKKTLNQHAIKPSQKTEKAEKKK